MKLKSNDQNFIISDIEITQSYILSKLQCHYIRT